MQCHNDKYAKKSLLFQSSKHGHLNPPEELDVEPAGEEWQEQGSSAGEGKVGAAERDHGSGRDIVLLSKRLIAPAFEKTGRTGGSGAHVVIGSSVFCPSLPFVGVVPPNRVALNREGTQENLCCVGYLFS